MTQKYLPGKLKLVLKFLGLVSILLIYSSNKQVVDTSNTKTFWLEDYSQAINKAKVENKPLLVYFSAQDYCAPCNKLKTEIFEDQRFKNYASKNLVLLKLIAPIESPSEYRMTPASFMDSGYVQSVERRAPLVLLMNKKGRIISRTGYRKGGATAFLTYLEESLSQE